VLHLTIFFQTFTAFQLSATVLGLQVDEGLLCTVLEAGVRVGKARRSNAGGWV